MSLTQAAPRKSFWRTWRRELIRGGVLFSLVVCTGLVIRNIKVDVPGPWGMLGSFGDFDWGDGEGGSLFGHGREVGDPWEFRSQLKPSQHVWIRNTNGPIEVVQGTGDMLEVLAEKSWRHSSPENVELVAVPSARGVTICAMWDARERNCGEAGDYRMNGVRKNDVAVRFTVTLPRGVPLDASTVNGTLEINGVKSPVEATTVNGQIQLNDASGPLKATTVNGNIDADMLSCECGEVRLVTVNGSVSLGLPLRVNVNIDAETVNGRVKTDFPVKIMGKLSTRHLRGTIGTGGPTLKLSTVNGSISIHEADANPNPNPDPELTPAPERPARPARPSRAPRPARTPTTQQAPATPPPN